MGLFKKKSPPPLDETPAGGLPAADPKKRSKATVDPVDFLNLRAEMLELKARLEVAEQAKAVVEARLAALDATTTALSTERLGGDDVRARIDELEAKFGHHDGSSGASETVTTVAVAEIDPELLARIDSLTARVDEFTSAPPAPPPPPPAPAALAAAPDPELRARFDELAARLDELSADRDREMREPVWAVSADDAPAGLDADTLARIDELSARVDGVDQTVSQASEQFAGQLAQLNARVVAQAELGAQLSSLRDRLDELQRAEPAGATAEPDPQIGQLAERMTANDEAVRRTAEHLATLEQRIESVSTELANQLSELGRDIDGLAARADDGTESDDETVQRLVEQLVEQLRTGQVKLANEQARYEIAFRQDLAALAEQVRRGR